VPYESLRGKKERCFETLLERQIIKTGCYRRCGRGGKWLPFGEEPASEDDTSAGVIWREGATVVCTGWIWHWRVWEMSTQCRASGEIHRISNLYEQPGHESHEDGGESGGVKTRRLGERAWMMEMVMAKEEREQQTGLDGERSAGRGHRRRSVTERLAIGCYRPTTGQVRPYNSAATVDYRVRIASFISLSSSPSPSICCCPYYNKAHPPRPTPPPPPPALALHLARSFPTPLATHYCRRG
jgi:hypothetical protein